MKLIDLLVQELPKRGGWPEDGEYAAQDRDGQVCFFIERPYTMSSGEVWDSGCSYGASEWLDTASDYNTAIITHDQYEAALAASQQPVWNGEGLPPVGTEFEYGTHRTRAKCLGIGHHMVFASKGNPDDEESDFEEFMISIQDSEFHPIRTEEERKRSDICDKIYGAITAAEREDNRSDMAEAVYDAIAAGKIPGVKLTD